MARTKMLDEGSLEQVRAHLGIFLAAHPNPAFANVATFIQGSFEIFELPLANLSAAAKNPRSLTEYLRRTTRWHHQLVQRGVAIGIAYSGPSGSFHDDWSIYSVVASPLASKVAKAIEIIDRERPQEDSEAIYFTIPAYKAVCLLIRAYSSEELFVISSSMNLPGAEEGKFYKVPAFLNALLQREPVKGVLLK
jgi:hypothetical protein